MVFNNDRKVKRNEKPSPIYTVEYDQIKEFDNYRVHAYWIRLKQLIVTNALLRHF